MVQFFSKWFTPNQMTYLRILLIPVIYLLVFIDTENLLAVAWWLFFIACLTDYWDGVLARHNNNLAETEMGKLMDPIADKLLIIALLILLVFMHRASPHLTAVIAIRELAVSGLRSIAAIKGVTISASSGGKAKTISQMFAVGFLILHHRTLGIPCHEVGVGLLWVATFIAVWSGIRYFLAYLQSFSEKPTT